VGPPLIRKRDAGGALSGISKFKFKLLLPVAHVRIQQRPKKKKKNSGKKHFNKFRLLLPVARVRIQQRPRRTHSTVREHLLHCCMCASNKFFFHALGKTNSGKKHFNKFRLLLPVAHVRIQQRPRRTHSTVREHLLYIVREHSLYSKRAHVLCSKKENTFYMRTHSIH